MKYIVECRSKDTDGNISGVTFSGFGNGLSDKTMAKKVFSREVESKKWDAVYMDKVMKNGESIDVDCWYKN